MDDNTMSDHEKVIAATVAVQKAREAYVEAHAIETAACTTTNTRLNELNQAQEEYDKAFENFKKLSPTSSNWRRRDEKSFQVIGE